MGKKIRAQNPFISLRCMTKKKKKPRKFKVQKKIYNRFSQQKPMKIETEGGEKRWEEV